MDERASTSGRLVLALAIVGAVVYGIPLLSREIGGSGASLGDLVCAIWKTLSGSPPGVPCDAVGMAVAMLVFAAVMLVGRPSVRL